MCDVNQSCRLSPAIHWRLNHRYKKFSAIGKCSIVYYIIYSRSCWEGFTQTKQINLLYITISILIRIHKSSVVVWWHIPKVSTSLQPYWLMLLVSNVLLIIIYQVVAILKIIFATNSVYAIKRLIYGNNSWILYTCV